MKKRFKVLMTRQTIEAFVVECEESEMQDVVERIEERMKAGEHGVLVHEMIQDGMSYEEVYEDESL